MDISCPRLAASLANAEEVFKNFKKLTIEDVSREINATEDKLVQLGATDVFGYDMEKLRGPQIQYDDHSRHPVTLIRQLVWKKHGQKWRLLYCLKFKNSSAIGGEDGYDGSVYPKALSYENDKLQQHYQNNKELFVRKTSSEGTAFSAPVDDLPSDLRKIMHQHLASFVDIFVADWKKNPYFRQELKS